MVTARTGRGRSGTVKTWFFGDEGGEEKIRQKRDRLITSNRQPSGSVWSLPRYDRLLGESQ